MLMVAEFALADRAHGACARSGYMYISYMYVVPCSIINKQDKADSTYQTRVTIKTSAAEPQYTSYRACTVTQLHSTSSGGGGGEGDGWMEGDTYNQCACL